jgi:hypothetical protein
MACIFWLAQTYHNPLYAYSEHEEIANRPANAAHLVWYAARPPARSVRRQFDSYFRGPVEVVTMRSAWDDPNALFVGIKAGYNQVNHGHLDLGNFELDALGVRWVRDLGADNYNLPGYWEGRRGGQRWSYYRLNSSSHNICMLAGEDQDPMAKSRFTSTKVNQTDPSAVVDLTQAYADFAKSASRGIKMVADRSAVLVQDEFAIAKSCDVVWGMTTDAGIQTEDASVARLKLEGKELVARVLSPEGAAFTVGSAEQEPPQKTNKGVKRLLIRLPEIKGEVRIAVLFSPVRSGEDQENTVEIKPLAQW